MAEKIGEYLVRVGAMTRDQAETVVRLQSAGDRRKFGAIAEELHYITSYDRIKEFLSALKA